jgi:hypothetical protein
MFCSVIKNQFENIFLVFDCVMKNELENKINSN